jgi:hypothetical protein
MASRIKVLNLEDVDEAEMWMESFEAKCRIKKVKEIDDEGNMAKTDLFMSPCGRNSLLKIKYLVSLDTLRDLKKLLNTSVNLHIDGYQTKCVRSKSTERNYTRGNC